MIKHTILPNKCSNSNKCQGHGTIVTVEGKVQTKQINYGDKVNLVYNLAVLDHSTGMLVAVVGLYQPFFVNCRHPNSLIDAVVLKCLPLTNVGKQASENNKCPVM